MENLESIIEDSITDASLPSEPVEASPEGDGLPEVIADPTTPEPAHEDPAPVEPVQESTDSTDAAVQSPAAKEATKPVQDDFEKKFGIPAQSSSGRENRIPYTRVKKITERAIADTKAQLTKEIATSHVPVAKYQELETKIKEYEPKVQQMAEFENVMVNDAPRFLDMLATIPAYARIFKELTDAAERGQVQVQAPVEPTQPVDPNADRPLPDQELSDGSFVYSMDGLDKLNAWNRAQARKEILKEVEQRFGPLEADYKRYQSEQAVIPQVQAQIADARTWPLFNENEAEIVAALQKYPKASLERVYQHVVWPKIKAEQDKLREEVTAKAGEAKVSRDSIRAEILAELKIAPRSTSVTAGSSKPEARPSNVKRTMEEIVADSIKGLKR